MSVYTLVSQIVTLVKNNRITTNNYPPDVEYKIQEAVQLKRSAKYEQALQIYLNIFSNQGIVQTGVLNGLFKVIAAAGYCREARELLEIGNRAMHNSTTIYNPFGLPNNFEDHLRKMDQAIRNKEALETYLKSISGNPYYSLPRNYNEILSEYQEVFEKMSKTLIKFKLYDLSKLAYLNNYMESIFHDVEYIFFWWDAPYQVYTYGYQYTTNGRSIPSIIDHDILASNGVRKDDSVFIYVLSCYLSGWESYIYLCLSRIFDCTDV